MTRLISYNYIKYHSIYHRVIYALIAVLAVMLNVLGLLGNGSIVIAMCVSLVVFVVGELLLENYERSDSSTAYLIVKIVEMLALSVIEAWVPFDNLLIPAIEMLTFFMAVELIVHGSEFDGLTVFLRKLLIILPILVNLVVAYGIQKDSHWFCFVLLHCALIAMVYYISDWFVAVSAEFQKINTNLNVEIANVEDINDKLVEYQERVKDTNEQINYQKINLARMNKELEQINVETKSQNEIMRYLTSTFDVEKCIDVITDTIMSVKQTKICALFVDKNAYMNKHSNCVIKTNYSSMRAKLNKEIVEIYTDVVENHYASRVLTCGWLKKYRFIGDSDINSLAILPLTDGDVEYGIMLVGSDREEFFEKGLDYYENCLIELNLSIKTARMYYQMEEMAKKDGLTGIYNRIYFARLFENATAEVIKNNKPISVALFDIDKFKNVNDTYGHLAGDMVIKMVASVGQKYAEKYNGFASRYGGEEFLLVLPDYDAEKSMPIIEAMHKEIRETVVHYEGEDININICIGLSSYPNLCKDTKLLVSRADKAMYYGKKNGRGRIVLDCAELDNLL